MTTVVTAPSAAAVTAPFAAGAPVAAAATTATTTATNVDHDDDRHEHDHRIKVIHVLQQFCDQLRRDAKTSGQSASGFRAKSCAGVIAHLRKRPHLYANEVDGLLAVHGIGKNSVRRIHEIVTTGTLAELQQQDVDGAPSDAHDPVLHETTTQIEATTALQEVVGIGPAAATRLSRAGITLAALLDDNSTARSALNGKQLLGVKHYEALRRPIPRAEIVHFETNVLPSLMTPCQWVLCGSYRRGGSTSNDVDLLVSHPTWDDDATVRRGLRSVVGRLDESGLLVDHLTHPSKVRTKYMGFARLIREDGTVRRLDVRAVPHAQYIPAMLYFTGSKEENLRLRRLALQQGCKLSEYGLYRKKDEAWLHLACEEDVYAQLQTPYRTPTER